MSRQKIGQQAENQAEEYLLAQGLRLIMRNFRSRMGEIDLIMQDSYYLVFIEVRYRKNNAFGGAAASVNYTKQRKLRLTAQLYIQINQQQHIPCRFDVVTLTSHPDHPTIEWVKNAFEAK